MCRGYHNSEYSVAAGAQRAEGFSPRGPANAMKRRGTVLVMVVAILVMLFVIGVTFLSTVTFESQSIDGAKRALRQTGVIDALSREVRTILHDDFLGIDGKAWNRDSEAGPGGMASAIGVDTYGEIPGVHPLLASIEPYETTGALDAASQRWFFHTASDLELSQAGASLDTAVEGGISGARLVDINRSFDRMLYPNHLDSDLDLVFNTNDFEETTEGGTQLVNLVFDGGLPPQLFRRDADGDGGWDSYEYELPLDRFPPTMRGDLADQLRADGAPPGNSIYYALRVIPHGGMVDVGNAHQTLLEVLPDLDVAAAVPGCVSGPYIASGEERLLRRRFILPPRRLPLSSLQSRVTPNCDPGRGGQIPEALYRAFVPETEWGGFTAANSSTVARWWPINTGDNGADIAEIQGIADPDNPGWLEWMDPNNTAGFTNPKYDYRHLITTVSHDDNLMRLGRDVGAADDWVDAIIVAERISADPTITTPPVSNFSIEDWPEDVDLLADFTAVIPPLNGRLKISLPGLVDKLFPGGLDTHVGHANEPVFIETIQDAFMLMLRNVDLNLDDAADAGDSDLIALTAAALTANLIDFADSDEVPTRVAERDPVSGAAATPIVYAYGLERQPFITEVYYAPGAQPVYAVELYNPYDDTITLDASYYLEVRDGGATTRVDWDPPGSGVVSISPNRFVVIHGDTPSPGTSLQPIPGFAFDPGSPVKLIREVNYTGTLEPIVLDEMQAPTAAVSSASVQRHSRANGRWFAPIPFAVQNPPLLESLGRHAFSGATSVPPELRPVELQFADTGDMTTAFPTTGSLLLLCRYANSATASFTALLVGPVDDNGQLPQNKIDNGHMPVFDTSNQGVAVQAPTPALELNIPWGQLVFDYFTALPLEHIYNYDLDSVPPGDPIPNDITPTIDQGGLRVHGRIDINAAPWTVLAGLPLVPGDRFSAYPGSATNANTFQGKIIDAAQLDPDTAIATPIGALLAQSIVAYREARQIADVSAGSTADFGSTRLRAGTGFLSVGELANVRGSGDDTSFNIDGELSSDANDYVRAVAVLVALGDWVTTKSHVFTIYGTLRGAGTKSAVDEKAIRFQETVDRLPSFFDNRLPRLIGRRTVGAYTQADQD